MSPVLVLAPAATAVELELILKAKSAKKTPTLLSVIPKKTRKLKNASRDDDLFFMFYLLFLSCELYKAVKVFLPVMEPMWFWVQMSRQLF